MQIHFDLVHDKIEFNFNSKLLSELPLKNNIPRVVFGDYTNQIHYTTTDHHVVLRNDELS